MRIATREQERLQVQLFHIIGKHSGHSWQEIEEFFIRDRFLNAREAQSYGLIDQVLGNTSSLITLKDTVLEVAFDQPSTENGRSPSQGLRTET